MSIFGPKKKGAPETQLDEEQMKELTTQICTKITNEVNKKLTDQINSSLNRQLTTVKAEQQNLFSIYATLNADIVKANTNIDKVQKEVNLNTTANKKGILTVWAESVGHLEYNEIFSFGNGGKENGIGYCLMYNGRIIKMGISSQIGVGEEISIFIALNGSKFIDNKMYHFRCENPNTLGCWYTFPDPYEVKAGDILNIISGNTINNSKNTVVTLVIEIDL